ncbi:hypothetical protein BJX99DRAFT_264666 [Aspergillus californicus]
MSNTYIKYKRDQKLLVYWILHVSNNIIKAFPETTTSLNTSGEITLSSLISLSELIAKHISPLVKNDLDPEIEQRNESHKFWIDGLTKAFNILGGKGWSSRKKDDDEVSEEDEEEVVFANRFSGLNLDDEGDESEDKVIADGSAPSVRRAQKKGKKGKGEKRKKPKRKGKPPVAPSLDKVPLESYRIIEDQTGIVTDYLLAVYSLITEWSELRQFLQDTWHDVAYKGLNSSVASTLSNIALAMISKAGTNVEADFPGHTSFETIVKTISRGDYDKAQECSKDIDVKELFMINAYEDLHDFVVVFQLNRSGKPTKSMLAEIRDWNPTLDLKRATKEERLKWRRSYTINWLYDLVNVFSSIVVQRRTLKGQHIVLETVDWSVHGPWNEHRRLFGLNEFAGEITTLAMQKPGTDVRSKITLPLVFQLQNIVDSLTVSRGWSPGGLQGDTFTAPARNYRPRRDVDLFLDRNVQNRFRGFCTSVQLLNRCFEKDARLHDQPGRNEAATNILTILCEDFVDWLGETKYMHGLKTIPPSRFSKTNSNGLWEYSPYLCGVGLQEGLEMVHAFGMQIWDRIPEPLALVHLHNMLLKKGYISRPIGLYNILEGVFQNEFFVDGIVPDSNFLQALNAVLHKAGKFRDSFASKVKRRRPMRGITSIHDAIDLSYNRIFKTKSLTRLFREAYYVPDRIPDDEIPVPSILSALRVTQTKRAIDPAIGKKVLQDTELVKRWRSIGFDDDKIYGMIEAINAGNSSQGIPEHVLNSLPIPEGYTRQRQPQPRSDTFKAGFSNVSFLVALEVDLKDDVGFGQRPMLGLNYIAATTHMMMVFNKFEEKLKQLRNPLWVQAYEGTGPSTQNKQALLTILAIQSEDEECLRVMAEVFESTRIGYIPLAYWDDDLDDNAAL